MAKSILSNRKKCWICSAEFGVELLEIQIRPEPGYHVWMCARCKRNHENSPRSQRDVRKYADWRFEYERKKEAKRI